MPERTQPSLIGRTIDYLFGRNTLIGVASFMLLAISGYATWHGMRDFIIGVSAQNQQASGSFSISNDVLVIVMVVALTFLMWLALRETFGTRRRFIERLVTFRALSLSRPVVGGFRLRLLVEPDRRRRSDPHQPLRVAARTPATPARRSRRG